MQMVYFILEIRYIKIFSIKKNFIWKILIKDQSIKNSKRWREKKKWYVNKKTSSIWKLYIQISLLEWRLKRERRENVSSLYSRTILRELASVIIFSHFDASTSKRQKSSRAKPTCCSWVKIQATNERAAQRTRKVSRAYEWFDV